MRKKEDLIKGFMDTDLNPEELAISEWYDNLVGYGPAPEWLQPGPIGDKFFKKLELQREALKKKMNEEGK